MLKECYIHPCNRKAAEVLILILMEHAQRETNDMITQHQFVAVLILILMEHAQRGGA